ncbi:serine protease [Patescibacteria group bacterium]|nr:MAG: serine protease [Patescibacteria group bacterium]
MKLPTDNLSYPVKLLVGGSSGSGFIIRHGNQLYLVTAKHVLYQQDQVTKAFNLLDKKMKMIAYPVVSGKVSTKPQMFELNIEALSDSNDLKAHASGDIVVIKLAEVRSEDGNIDFLETIQIIQKSEGMIVHYDMTGSRRFDDVVITNDIFILGYPVSLSTPEMNQIDYDSPLVRKGIIAGKNNINKSLILDCPVYGGNSGGLVLEMNATGLGNGDIHLIGVVVQFVPFVDQWRNVRFPELYNTNLQNSGYSVALPVDYIYDLIGEIQANLKA